MSAARRWWTLVMLCAAVSLAPAARADPPKRVDEATRAAARADAEEALKRFDNGDYTGALNLFERADALVHVPTLGLMAARCLQKLGRQVEASERYVAVTRIKLDPGAAAAQAKAQVSAQEERAALLPKIPVLVIVLDGAAPTGARVTLDGTTVRPEVLGLKRPTDPGPHWLAATRGAEVVTREIALRPGETQTVTLKLTGAAGAAGAPLAEAASAPAAKDAPAPGAGLRTAGLALVGVGGAGLLVGAITGGVALSTKSSLDAAGCVGGHCPPGHEDAVSRYNAMRMASGAGLIGGTVLAGAGVTLFLVGRRAAPGTAEPAGARLSPWIGPGSVGVAGAF